MSSFLEEPFRGGYPDPSIAGLSGIERLRTFDSGLSPPPPMHHLLGTRYLGVGEGTASFEQPLSAWLASSTGAIPGGALAPAADGALGCAIQTGMPEATLYTTSELSLTMLRAVRPGGKLILGGQLIHAGRSIALSEVFILEEGDTDADDRLVAHGTSRGAVFPPLDPPPVLADLEPIELLTYDTPDPYLRPVKGEPLPQEVWDRMSGLEICRAQISGELPAPPLAHLTGIELTEADEGTVTFTMPCTGWHSSPARTVQGGFTAMLADLALQGAAMTTVPAGVAFAGIDLKVNYLRPVHPDGRLLTATGRVLHGGRTIAVASAALHNADGKPVALATGSSMFLPDRPADLGRAELG